MHYYRAHDAAKLLAVSAEDLPSRMEACLTELASYQEVMIPKSAMSAWQKLKACNANDLVPVGKIAANVHTMSPELLLGTAELFWDFYEAMREAEAKGERTGGKLSFSEGEVDLPRIEDS